VDVTVKEDVVNGLLHIFSALLGTAANRLVCVGFPWGEVQGWAKDWALLVTS